MPNIQEPALPQGPGHTLILTTFNQSHSTVTGQTHLDLAMALPVRPEPLFSTLPSAPLY